MHYTENVEAAMEKEGGSPNGSPPPPSGLTRYHTHSLTRASPALRTSQRASPRRVDTQVRECFHASRVSFATLPHSSCLRQVCRLASNFFRTSLGGLINSLTEYRLHRVVSRVFSHHATEERHHEADGGDAAPQRARRGGAVRARPQLERPLVSKSHNLTKRTLLST